MHADFADLRERWRRSRWAALAAVIEPVSRDEAEEHLLARALAHDHEQAYYRVFDNSLRLGQSLVRFYRTPITLDTLARELPSLGTPCLQGASTRPSPDEPAFYVERRGCDGASRLVCGYYREAIEGLVLGATGGLRHARHESRSASAERCLDVIYLDPESPLRFGPIPPEIEPALTSAKRQARAFTSSCELSFLGLSEGVLYYEIKRHGCGDELSLAGLVERAVARKLAGVVCKEVSPRPVMGEAG